MGEIAEKKGKVWRAGVLSRRVKEILEEEVMAFFCVKSFRDFFNLFFRAVVKDIGEDRTKVIAIKMFFNKGFNLGGFYSFENLVGSKEMGVFFGHLG